MGGVLGEAIFNRDYLFWSRAKNIKAVVLQGFYKISIAGSPKKIMDMDDDSVVVSPRLRILF
jgi:hypothetical protein